MDSTPPTTISLLSQRFNLLKVGENYAANRFSVTKNSVRHQRLSTYNRGRRPTILSQYPFAKEKIIPVHSSSNSPLYPPDFPQIMRDTHQIHLDSHLFNPFKQKFPESKVLLDIANHRLNYLCFPKKVHSKKAIISPPIMEVLVMSSNRDVTL